MRVVFPEEYVEFTKKVQNAFPFFDNQALDAGRFFYGNPETEVTIIEGTTSVYPKNLEETYTFFKSIGVPLWLPHPLIGYNWTQ